MLSVLLFLFGVVTLFQTTVWWTVYGKRWPTAPSGKTPSGLPCTVLICARNEAENLQNYLPAVLEQGYPSFEVLVVDDSSEDETPAILAIFQKKYPHLRVLRVAEKTAPGKKQALVMGLAAARYDVMVLTDADCRPAGPGWLAAMTSPFDNPQVEIVLGYAPFFPGKNGLNRWACYETAFTAVQYLSFAGAGMPYMGVGRNLAWRKNLFERSGGFSAHIHLASGDDDLLVNAAAKRGNTAVCLDAEAFVYSAAKTSWTSWFRQKRRHLGAGPLYRPLHRAVLGALALTHVLHYGLAALLLVLGFGTKYVFYGCLLREGSIALISFFILPRLGERRLAPWVVLFDVLMAAYYALFVPFALIQQKFNQPWT